MLFGEIRQPRSAYVLIPRHSSETRRYIPMSYFTPDVIVGDSCLFVADATGYHFGVLSSAMHMAFVRQVCGRIKSDYRYSNRLVYNNYPWPQAPSVKQHATIQAASERLLLVRTAHQARGASLADLYDPVAMPPDLVRAHADLDRSVDLAYRSQPFTSERQRVEYLFALYEKITAPLVKPAKARTSTRQTR
jgi:hypothetical protein